MQAACLPVVERAAAESTAVASQRGSERIELPDALAQRGHGSCLCHGDLLSAGLPKPDDPDRRRTAVYDLKCLSTDGKGRASNLAQY